MKKSKVITSFAVGRGGLVMCSPHLTAPLNLKFPEGVVKDSEVVNAGEMGSLIKTFISQHQIKPLELVMIITPDLCFEKDLTKVGDADQSREIQNFLDTVPISSTSWRVFKAQNVTKLVVINRDFFEAIKGAFSAQGFEIVAVVPGFVLGEIGIKGEISAESCRIMLHKMEWLKENSFISPAPPQNFYEKKQLFFRGHQTLLIILSLLALGFLGFTLFWTLRRPTPTRATQMAQVPVQVATLVPTPNMASTSAYTVLVLNGTGQEGFADEFRSQLEDRGFLQIAVGNTEVTAPGSIVVFRPSVPESIRSLVMDLARNLTATVSSLENTEGEYDIHVSLITNTP